MMRTIQVISIACLLCVVPARCRDLGKDAISAGAGCRGDETSLLQVGKIVTHGVTQGDERFSSQKKEQPQMPELRKDKDSDSDTGKDEDSDKHAAGVARMVDVVIAGAIAGAKEEASETSNLIAGSSEKAPAKASDISKVEVVSKEDAKADAKAEAKTGAKTNATAEAKAGAKAKLPGDFGLGLRPNRDLAISAEIHRKRADNMYLWRHNRAQHAAMAAGAAQSSLAGMAVNTAWKDRALYASATWPARSYYWGNEWKNNAEWNSYAWNKAWKSNADWNEFAWQKANNNNAYWANQAAKKAAWQNEEWQRKANNAASWNAYAASKAAAAATPATPAAATPATPATPAAAPLT